MSEEERAELMGVVSSRVVAKPVTAKDIESIFASKGVPRSAAVDEASAIAKMKAAAAGVSPGSRPDPDPDPNLTIERRGEYICVISERGGVAVRFTDAAASAFALALFEKVEAR